jgi:hypothetical protein
MSWNRLFRSARLRFVRGGRGGGGPLGFAVAIALGLTEVVRLCDFVDFADLAAEGVTVLFDEGVWLILSLARIVCDG